MNNEIWDRVLIQRQRAERHMTGSIRGLILLLLITAVLAALIIIPLVSHKEDCQSACKERGYQEGNATGFFGWKGCRCSHWISVDEIQCEQD
jgi:hypothetical protein